MCDQPLPTAAERATGLLTMCARGPGAIRADLPSTLASHACERPQCLSYVPDDWRLHAFRCLHAISCTSQRQSQTPHISRRTGRLSSRGHAVCTLEAVVK